MGVLMRAGRHLAWLAWAAWLVAFVPALAQAQEDDAELAQGDDEDDESFDEARTILLSVDLGTGLAFRELEWPIAEGAASLSLGPSAALDVALAMVYDPPGWLSLGMGVRYQTTVGATVDEEPIAGVTRPMGIRAARFEAMLAPTAALGDVVSVALELGYGVRGLRTHAHDQAPPTLYNLQTPDYTLAGPLVRLALDLSPTEAVTITLAPEVQALVSVGTELTRRGASDGGLAVGGQATIAVAVHPLLSLFVGYREAHATISGQPGRVDTSDVERFLTAGLRGTP